MTKMEKVPIPIADALTEMAQEARILALAVSHKLECGGSGYRNADNSDDDLDAINRFAWELALKARNWADRANSGGEA